MAADRPTTTSDTIRLEERLTLMAAMLQRAAEEARSLVDAYIAEASGREEGRPATDIESGEKHGT